MASEIKLHYDGDGQLQITLLHYTAYTSVQKKYQVPKKLR
jgi:hypothetical protein